MRRAVGKKKIGLSGLGMDEPRRERRKRGGGETNSSEQIPQPGGEIRTGSRGEWKRGSGATYRTKDGKELRPQSPAIKREDLGRKWRVRPGGRRPPDRWVPPVRVFSFSFSLFLLFYFLFQILN